MPNRAYKICAWPGCTELSMQHYCDRHQLQRDQEQDAKYIRDKDSSYDAQWQRLRLSYLSKHPLCQACEDKGLIVPAVLVHHIKPIKDGGAVLEERNLKALCNSCHEEIHKVDRWKKRIK